MFLYAFQNFYKRRNSTKQPDPNNDPRYNYNVQLKENCSCEKPVFIIEGIDFSVNYVIWNQAMYFVDDIVVLTNNLYELHCSIDLLGTWKAAIGSATLYVERAASDYDPDICDRMITSKQLIADQQTQTVTSGMFSATGCYIIPVMNRYGLQLIGTTSLDAFAPMFYPSTYGLTDFSSWLQAGIASIGDYAQYFGKVFWVPFNLSSIVNPTTTNVISVGTLSWTLSNSVYLIDPASDDAVRTEAGIHYFNKFTPYYGDWRDASPAWTRYEMYIPGTGIVNIDPLVAADPNNYIHIYSYLSLINGDLTTELRSFPLSGGTYSLVGHYHGNLSADIPYGISSGDINRVIAPISHGIGAGVANAAVENYAGAVASVAGGMLSAAHTAITPGVSMLGGSGSMADAKYFKDYRLTRTVYASAAIPNASEGRPLYQYCQISSLSGYVKCAGASLNIAGLGQEITDLNRMLNTGFYYE